MPDASTKAPRARTPSISSARLRMGGQQQQSCIAAWSALVCLSALSLFVDWLCTRLPCARAGVLVCLDEIALEIAPTQPISPIANSIHLSVVRLLSVVCCLSLSWLLKPFDGFTYHLAGTHCVRLDYLTCQWFYVLPNYFGHLLSVIVVRSSSISCFDLSTQPPL